MLGLVFAAIALFGGSARLDVNLLLFLRPLCMIAIGVLLVLPITAPARQMRAPTLLLALLALAIAVQLVPLPPSIWTSLPGHERYAEAALAAGLDQPWRPISLTPWRTWNSLLTLLPAIALLMSLRGISYRQEPRVIYGFLAFLAISLVLGVFQVGGVIDGPPLPYRFFAEDSVVGFFANRNHAAAVLATGFPVLRMWSLAHGKSKLPSSRRRLIAMVSALVLLVMIVVTGSRTGIVVGFASLAASLAMSPLEELGAGMRKSHAKWLRILVIAVPTLVVALLVLFGKALSIDRFVGDDLLAEKRLTFLPVLLDIIRDFLPFGSGFGSFDPVFRSYEPDWGLSRKYFNNAHNDLIELVLTGGIPALLVLLGFVGWIGWRIWRSWKNVPSGETISTRAGAIMAGSLMLASLTDYPLRTPLAGAVLVFATYLMSRPMPSHRSSTEKSR
ncbi:hypothetical protein GCM10010990_06370 [Croceicoccus mobilis]|uniref:O-antigen ligase-related domain-containing protein n=2 Tax=Croceicoccus mobilis TaxID=1703339 RepID=A0A916YTS2_9SPHN|nr:hypothetical protein GCM10010990_06370 [Croceicoccus mobilis]